MPAVHSRDHLCRRLFADIGVQGDLLGSTCCVSSSKCFLWPTAVKTTVAIVIKMLKTDGDKCILSSREDSKSMTWQRQSQPYSAKTHWLNLENALCKLNGKVSSLRVAVLNLAQAGTLSCLEKSSSGMGKPSMCAAGNSIQSCYHKESIASR